MKDNFSDIPMLIKHGRSAACSFVRKFRLGSMIFLLLNANKESLAFSDL